MNKFLALSLLPLLLFTACKAKSTFKAVPKSGELAPAERVPEVEEGEPLEVEPEMEGEVEETLEIPSEPGVQTKEFDLGTIQPKLDLVWMEDGNLNHITDGGKSLSSNFAKFLESIKGRSDIKVIFIGHSMTSLTAKSDPNAKDVVTFLTRYISQSGALAVLAAGLCPPEQSSVKADHPWQVRGAPVPSGKICGRPLNIELVKKLESGMNIDSTQRVYQADFYNHSDFSNPGFLRNILRSDARMVIVNVAPGTQGLYQYLPQYGKIEEPISPKNFIDVTGLNKDNVTYHNFTKTRDGDYGSCGAPYNTNKPATLDRNILPDLTGGKVFDMCLPDHTSSFAELTKNILEVTRSNFKLAPSGKVQIVKVMLGAKALSTADYTMKGTTISLNKPTPLTAKDKLIVSFKVD